MNRQFNFRFLALVLITIILVAGVTYFLHSRQRDRIALALQQQAESAVEAKQWQKAISFYERYLNMKPADSPTYTKYAELLDQVAKTNEDKIKALYALDKAVIKDPLNDPLRRKLVRLAMIRGLDEITRPEPHLVKLLDHYPKDMKLNEMLAERLYQEGKYLEAVAQFEKLIQLNPKDTDAYLQKAVIQRVNLNLTKQAEETMAEMVKVNNTAKAHLAFSVYWGYYGTPKQVEQEIERAAACDPKDAGVLLAQAKLAQDRSKLMQDPQEVKKEIDNARDLLKQCRSLHPKDIRPLSALAALELEAGNAKEAIEVLKQALVLKEEKDFPYKDREDLYFSMAEAYLQAGMIQEAESLVQEMRKKEYLPVMVQLLEGQVLVSKGEWVKATRLFEDALPQITESKALVRQCSQVLAQCYERIGDVDNRIAAYRHILGEDPMNVSTNANLIKALADQGRVEEALAMMRPLIERDPKRIPAIYMGIYADLLLQQTLSRDPVDRNWVEFDAVLETLEKDAAINKAPTVAITLLRVRRQLAADQFEDAKKKLAEAQQRWPKDADLWAARANLSLQSRQVEEARKIIAQARAAIGDQPGFRFLEARMLLLDGFPKDTKALDQLTDDMGKLSPTQQLDLLRMMLDLRLRYGDLAGGIRLAEQQDKLLPNNLSLQLLRFDLAALNNDEARMKEIIDRIKQLEGPGGVYTPLAQALSLMWKASKNGDKKNLDQARVYLAAIAKKRSDWPRLQLAEGKLRDLQGDTTNTLASYQQAVKSGSRDAEALTWLMRTYHRQQRYAEASEMMKLIPPDRIVGDLTKVAAELCNKNRQFKEAMTWAAKAVSDDSKNFEDVLWKGMIFSRAGEQKFSEASLRKAIALSEGKEGKAWLALVQHFKNIDAMSAAEQTTREAQARLPQHNIWLPLCLEAIGKYDEAAKGFQAIVAAKPNDIEALREAADYFVRRGDGKTAEPLLTRLIDLQDKAPGDKVWAKRTLAVILASRGDYYQSRKALALLGLLDNNEKIITKTSNNEPIEDLRARAFVFGMNRSRALRLEATNVFEQMATRQARTNEDLFFQAKLHNDLGDWGKARDCMQMLLTRKGDNVEYLEYMIRNLLQRNDTNASKLYLERLAKQQPGSDLTIDLQACLLKVLGDDKGALALVEKHFLQSTPPRPEKAAELLEDMKLIEPAESIYRRLAKEVAKPEASLNLAKFLGRQRKLKEALQLCKAARGKAPDEEVGFISIEALYNSPQRTKEDMEDIGNWLESLVKEKPNAARLKLLAAMRNLQGRYEDSIKLYEQVVAMDKIDVLSRNNLAFLQAMQKKQFPEALKNLSEALAVIGPHPDLLDTRALVYLKMNKPDQSLEELFQAMDQDPSAIAQFHLACVYNHKRNRQSAMNAWEEMKQRKLTRDDVHPLEWPAFDALVQQFDGGILPPPPNKTQQ
jgi:cellulose synthase operon protein C